MAVADTAARAPAAIAAGQRRSAIPCRCSTTRSNRTNAWRAGCPCGRHVSQAEHDRDAALQLRCTPAESDEEALRRRGRLGGDARDVPARSRAPRLPAVRRRLDRACRAVAILPARHRGRGVRARRGRDREEGPQGRLHSDHLRDPDHHGAPDGLLLQARAQRRGDQDRRLGGHPRQDAQQGIRRRPHALADAARDHARRRLDADSLHHAGGREHQRPGDHAGGEA